MSPQRRTRATPNSRRHGVAAGAQPVDLRRRSPLRRVDLVSEHANPLALLGGVDAGGQNVHVAELATGLARLGLDIVVHTRRDDPAVPRQVQFGPGVVVNHVDAGPATPLPKDELLPYMGAFAQELSRAWRGQRPDVVFSHFWMSGLAALRAARPIGIPVAHTFHALGVVKRRHQGAHDTSPARRLALERYVAQQVDCIIATSGDEMRELATIGVERRRMRHVPCGVDLSRFCPNGAVEPRTGERARVLTVSRLVERKGIGNVIEAIAMLPDVELVIAGGPPEALLDDDPEANRFAAMVRHFGVGDRVDMRGGVPRESVPALIRSADVVACCPWYEPFGIVAVEAMACGRPVVASYVGGLAETIEHGVTGLHVPPRDPRRIAGAIATLLDDAPLRDRLGRTGAARAQRYDWPEIARETYDVLAEVVETRSRPSGTTVSEATG